MLIVQETLKLMILFLELVSNQVQKLLPTATTVTIDKATTQAFNDGDVITVDQIIKRHTSGSKTRMSDYVTFAADLNNQEVRAEVNSKADFDLAKSDGGVNGLRALSIGDKDYFAAVVTQAATDQVSLLKLELVEPILVFKLLNWIRYRR